MAFLRRLVLRFYNFLRPGRAEQELARELTSHLSLIEDDFRRQGMTREEARLGARRATGGVERAKELHRDARSFVWLDDARRDVRYAARGFSRHPGFTTAAILTLAIGISATTVAFGVDDHVILRPLTYRQPGRLFAIREVIPRLKTFPSVPVAAARFLEWRRSTQTFDSLALVGGASFTLTGSGEAERLYGARASGILWPMLGIEPQLGRVFRDDEDQPGRDRVVLLSDALWRGRFAADPQIVGRTIVLDREPHEIVGVLPADFQFPALSRLYGISIAGDRPELWTPIGLKGGDLGVGNFNFICIGRLRPGVEAPQAEAELNAFQAVLGVNAIRS